MEKPLTVLVLTLPLAGLRKGHTNQKRAQQVTADWTRNMLASVTWLKTQFTGALEDVTAFIQSQIIWHRLGILMNVVCGC